MRQDFFAVVGDFSRPLVGYDTRIRKKGEGAGWVHPSKSREVQDG